MTVRLNDPAHPAHSTHTISCNGRSAERIWEPDNPMPAQTIAKLTAACQLHRREVCGFITNDWLVFPVTNAHLEPRRNYYFDPEDTIRVVKEIYEEYETEIIGQYHTHPIGNPWPSPRDLRGWPNPDLGWRYWIATHDEVVEWRLVND